MNTNLGLIGKKLGTTQIFGEDGLVTRVTAIQTGPCVLLGKRTPAEHGYAALQLGFGAKREKHLSAPLAGFFKKVGADPAAVVREIRVEEAMLDQYEVGQTLKASDLFAEGQHVDVSGRTRGRGFTGVMRRHNYRGAGTDSHGTHEYHRHGGSIGQNMTPGRTFAGTGMPGQHGNTKTTVQNLRVAKILEEEGIVMVEGAVPGGRNGIVTVRGAVKKAQKAAAQS